MSGIEAKTGSALILGSGLLPITFLIAVFTVALVTLALRWPDAVVPAIGHGDQWHDMAVGAWVQVRVRLVSQLASLSVSLNEL